MGAGRHGFCEEGLSVCLHPPSGWGSCPAVLSCLVPTSSELHISFSTLSTSPLTNWALFGVFGRKGAVLTQKVCCENYCKYTTLECLGQEYGKVHSVSVWMPHLHTGDKMEYPEIHAPLNLFCATDSRCVISDDEKRAQQLR